MYTRLFVFLCFFISVTVQAQQVPDSSYRYPITAPMYETGRGPVVMIDGSHHNFHTLDNRYMAFANILRSDGYQLKANNKPITRKILQSCDIYVISNPLHESNVGNWSLPNPSAFTPEEIKAMEEWVKKGGSLFLIADHMPFAGAAADLGAAFGFEFLNSFAMDQQKRRFEYFTKADGTLLKDPLTEKEKVDSVVTFTGSAFRIPKQATPLIALTDDYLVLMPERAWQFDEETPFENGEGLYQIAYRQFGKGRVVVSGEAAMFSAQLSGTNRYPMGLNNPAARANNQFLLNLIHWLDQ